MSKRKKHTRRPASRRRRGISGIGGNMNELLGIAIGAAAAPFLDKLAAKALPTLATNKMVMAGAKAAIAVLILPKVSRSPIVNAAAKGIVAVSAVQLAAGAKLYGDAGAGIGDPDGDVYVDMNNIAGTGDDVVGMEVVSGLPNYYPNINGVENGDDYE